MRLKFTSLLMLLCFHSFSQPGIPVLSFGTNGKVVTPISTSNDYGRAIAVQITDGKIVVAGYAYNGSNDDFAVVRYNADGSLDNTFDADGKVITAISTQTDRAFAVAIQSDGKIVVGGYATIAGYSDFAVVRYNTDGSLDNTFDGDGKAVYDFSGGYNNEANTLAIQPDGKIIIAGYGYGVPATDLEFGIMRLNTDGSLDNTFDGDGKALIRFGSSTDLANSLAVQQDGKIIVAGSSNNDFAVARLNANGTLDNSFDIDGKLTTDFRSTTDGASTISIQSDGKIIVAGFSANSTNNDFALARYNADGSLDNTFDADGKVITAISENDQIRSLAIQSDGKIIAAGFSATGAIGDFVLARYSPTGTLDPTFDGDGMTILNFGIFDYGYAVKLFGMRIYVAGYTNANANNDFALAAVQNDATPLPLSLLTFTASKQSNSAVQLSWSTVNEQNVVAFEVERSANGKSFTSLGSVKAAGNSSSYSFTDAQPLSSVNYYRLRTVTANGKQSYSQVVIVRMNSTAKLEVYPNPVTDVLQLQTAATGKIDVAVYNAAGVMVKRVFTSSTSGVTTLPIDVRSFSKGLYLLQVQSASGLEITNFIKQ